MMLSMPSGGSNHDGERTENLSRVREKSEKENLYREDSSVPGKCLQESTGMSYGGGVT